MVDIVKKELEKYVNPKKAKYYPKFFKAFEGGYGEGDKFIGVTVPNQRKVAKKFYKDISLKEIESLLREDIHEYRLIALIIMTYKFEETDNKNLRDDIVDVYLNNTKYINNWDLVDLSAYKILGEYLKDKNRETLYKLAKSEDLWEQRISIISTYKFIKENEFEDTLELSKILLDHNHDLIHKAVGWMLREVGNRDYEIEYNFLKKYYKEMPRTMLRYSIEKFDENIRQDFLKGRI